MKYLISLFLMSFALSAMAGPKADIDSTPMHVRPDYPHIYIPGKIEMRQTGRIYAPVGDFKLQSPIVKVKINGHGPYNFMFDSGFSQSMISKKLAKRLKLPINDEKHINAITPNQVVKVFQTTHYVDTLEVGDVKLHEYNLIVTSSFEDEVDDFKDMHVDGILSGNAFYPKLITIDYKNEKLVVSDGELKKTDKFVNPEAIKGRTPKIRARIIFDKLKKEISQVMTIDTGCYAHIYINSCDIPEMSNFRGKENLLAYDYQGYTDREYFAQLYGKVEVLPDYKIQSPYITFASNNCQLEKRNGLLCRKFFERHKVTVDMVNYLVKVIPY